MARVDCIVMAGGRASRLGGAEKPLLRVCGRAMVLSVLDAAAMVCRRLLLVYSRHTPSLGLLCRSSAYPGLQCLESPGEGYARDLGLALRLLQPPVLVLPADMPLLSWEYLEDFLARALASPGVVVNLTTPRGQTGISLFKGYAGPWWDVVYPDTPALRDVDTRSDLEEAGELCQ